MNNDEKLYTLYGEKEACNFALKELEKDSKVQKYLKLKEQQEKLDMLINDIKLKFNNNEYKFKK